MKLAGRPNWAGPPEHFEKPRERRGLFRDLVRPTGDLLRFQQALLAGELFADPATVELLTERANLLRNAFPWRYGLGTMIFKIGRVNAAFAVLGAVVLATWRAGPFKPPFRGPPVHGAGRVTSALQRLIGLRGRLPKRSIPYVHGHACRWR